ncbi:MAG: sigma-70 family RNA polymerase sigma factor [Planctomycetes bacterium]|nr:sigma-70 family RNA polymerase sigma factor [Planctomycetota bacterium]
MRKRGETAFEQAALPHMEILYRVALRLTGRPADAEDLVQDTFLKAHRAFDRFEMREHGIRPWLLRILHNTYLNRAAKERNSPRTADSELLAFVADENEDNANVLAPPVLNYEKVDGEVRAAIEQLAPEFRAVLLLWATMEYTYQEIAEILGMPIGTVMSRLHRARQQLARSLHDYARENRLPTREEAS